MSRSGKRHQRTSRRETRSNNHDEEHYGGGSQADIDLPEESGGDELRSVTRLRMLARGNPSSER